MKLVLTLVLLAAPCSIPSLCAQNCSGGNPPDTVSLSIAGKNTWDALHDPDNEITNLCGFSANANIVGLEWSGIDLSPLGNSWCSEVAIDLSGSVSFRPAINDRHVAPCANGYSGGSPSNLQDNNLVFQADASGCFDVEFYETFDDVANQIDANITAGNITLYACPATELLPIELISFSGETAGNNNLLKWVTASEINSQWHVIERSVGGLTDWAETGRVAARGAANETTNYELRDEQPLPFAYYRLREIAFDGSEQFSPVISVRREARGFGIASISPNPGNDRVVLQYTCPRAGVVQASLYDSGGKMRSRSGWASEEGVNHQYLDIAHFEQGVYTVVLSDGYENASARLVKE
ncbi:MAG: T9SS type A sorting domain-containing protein [Saprospiraceae bacterium]